MRKILLSLAVVTLIISCQSSNKGPKTAGDGSGLGKLEVEDPKFYDLVAKDAKIEKLAEGFDWSEGPIWMKIGDFLLFSDVPQNVVYRWKEGEGIKEFLKPSGYTCSTPRGGS